MQYQIFITCGTSTLTNPARTIGTKVEDICKKWSNSIVNEEIPTDDRAIIENLWNSQIDKWCSCSEVEAKRSSAELNALISWQKQNQIVSTDCFCYLIHTDTVLGMLASQLLEEWLKNNGYQGVELVNISKLSTSNFESFEMGLSNLAKWAFDNTNHVDGVRYIFNVAGGFKSVAGFMQVLGQFVADETIYKFETGDEVLSIPHLPVSWSDVDSIRQQFDDYHRVSLGLLPRSLDSLNPLWVKNKSYTPWGQIAWENAKRVLYAETVYPIVCDKIKEGKFFRDSIKGLSPDRIYLINERLDDLCMYMLSDRKINVKRLDYKQLKGKHIYTHELDAWADQDAKRIFCTERDGNIVLEELNNALH